MTFKEKLKSLTAKQLVQVMIDGINRGWVKMDFNIWLDYYHDEHTNQTVVCGCAATAAICEINGGYYMPPNVELSRINRTVALGIGYAELDNLEMAYDSLARGSIKGFNVYAKFLDLSLLPDNMSLPMLHNGNYMTNLPEFQKYADSLS